MTRDKHDGGEHPRLIPGGGEDIAKHSAVTVEHYTPTWIVDSARAVMGGIDLDPASTSLVNDAHVHATRFYCEADDGLAHPWAGRVFLNPPGGKIGGKSYAGMWWTKLLAAYESFDIEQAVFVAYSLEIFQTAQRNGPPPFAFPFCVPRSRVKYLVRDGSAFREGTSPPNASAIVYLPLREHTPIETVVNVAAVERFRTLFTPHGAVRT